MSISFSISYLRRLTSFNRNAKLFLLSTALNGLGLSLFGLLYNLYILSIGFRQDMIGILTAITSMVAVAAALPMGWVASRLGYRNAQIVGWTGSAVSLVFPLLYPTAEALIICELIWGVAFTLVTIVGSPFIAENSTEEERPYLFSIQFVVLTLTNFVGCLFGGYLPRIVGTWLSIGPESPAAYQGALWVGTMLVAAAALPFFFMRHEKGVHSHVVRPTFRVRRPMHVMRVILPGVIAAAAGGMFVPFVNVIWKVSHGLSDASIGQILAVSSLGMAVVGMLAPALTRRFGLTSLIVVTQIVAVAGLAAFGFVPIFSVALLGYLSRDILMNVGRPLMGQFQMEVSDRDERAAVSSIFAMAVSFAWGVGSWVSGMWQTQGLLWLVFAASAGFYLLSAGLLQKMFGSRERAKTTVHPDSPLGLEEEVVLPAGSFAE